ncbi:hypothetical protein AcW1_009307 [Taiwanofungus camphoratus]|nr:hypothetical protein AcW1_009307 [Antrodia cinnamomea]
MPINSRTHYIRSVRTGNSDRAVRQNPGQCPTAPRRAVFQNDAPPPPCERCCISASWHQPAQRSLGGAGVPPPVPHLCTKGPSHTNGQQAARAPRRDACSAGHPRSRILTPAHRPDLRSESSVAKGREREA